MGNKEFSLHPALIRDCHLVAYMPFSRLLLMNDNRFPWFILVPEINEVRELHELSEHQQIKILENMMTVSRILQKNYSAHKINIGMLGNIVEQLHIHIIARHSTDFAWPGPVWGNGNAIAYEEDILHTTIKNMASAIEQTSS